LDEAGLLKTGQRIYDLERYYKTLLVSARAQVLNVDEEPIPRRYQVGEPGCSLTFCPGGGSKIRDCMALGRTAAQNAAAEETWS
jgi:hypothetical protein